MCFTVELPRRGSRRDRETGTGGGSGEAAQRFPAPIRLGATPVPIPNTTVKTQAADGTALETMWESRRVPDQKNNRKESVRTPDEIEQHGGNHVTCISGEALFEYLVLPVIRIHTGVKMCVS